MSSVAVTAGQGPNEATPPRIVPLWRDTLRAEQLTRLRALELQPGDDFGERAWQLAFEQWRQLPDEARIDLPSARVFGRILGLMRTGATLKTGKLLRLELSAAEIAELVGYSKATVEAALRWLGSEPIEYQGQQLARSLGLIHRGRRTAWAYLKGQLCRVYRTSRLVLTLFGRVLLGLGSPDAERAAKKRQQRQEERQETAAPPPPEPLEPVAGVEVGMLWLKRIQDSL